MAGACSNKFYSDAFSALLAGGTPPGLTLRLFTNNLTPALATALASFTECTATGYAGIALSSGTFSISGTSPVKITYPQQTFNFTSSVNIYGYYVTNTGNTQWYWGELGGAAPYVFGSGGGGMLVSLELDGPSS